MNNKLKFFATMLTCILLSINQVLADYSIGFKSYNDSGNESTTMAKLIDSGSDYIYSLTASKTSRTTSDGLKFGNNNNPGSLTLVMKSTGSYIGQIKASKITVKNIKKPASNGGDCQYEITYAEGGSTTGTLSLSTTASDKDINLTSTKTVESIHFYNNYKKEAFYMTGFTVVAAAAATSVTASPTSITFSANTLDGSGEAEGSATIDFSVTNGYKSSNQYLCAWTESDDDSKCEFYVNGGYASYCSGNATSVDDLSIEYYAVATGTHTGTLYINGYDSEGDAVEVTVSLSVTISAPACANTVTVAKTLAQTNGSFF